MSPKEPIISEATETPIDTASKFPAVKSLIETERNDFRTLETAFLHDGKMQSIDPSICEYDRMMVMKDVQSKDSTDPGYIVCLKSETRKPLIRGSNVVIKEDGRKTWQGTLSDETRVTIVSFVRPDLLQKQGKKIVNVQDKNGKTFAIAPDEIVR